MQIDKNATIVDVRTPAEFADEHFPGAVNIPLDEINNRIKEFENFQKPIVVYCKSGTRSRMALSILKQNAVTEAVNGGSIDEMTELKNK